MENCCATVLLSPFSILFSPVPILLFIKGRHAVYSHNHRPLLILSDLPKKNLVNNFEFSFLMLTGVVNFFKIKSKKCARLGN